MVNKAKLFFHSYTKLEHIGSCIYHTFMRKNRVNILNLLNFNIGFTFDGKLIYYLTKW